MVLRSVSSPAVLQRIIGGVEEIISMLYNVINSFVNEKAKQPSPQSQILELRRYRIVYEILQIHHPYWQLACEASKKFNKT